MVSLIFEATTGAVAGGVRSADQQGIVPPVPVLVSLKENVMDWALIISGVLNVLLAKCFKTTAAEAQTPQDFVRSKWNATTKSFDEQLLRQVDRRGRAAIAHARRHASHADRKTMPKLTPDQVRQLSIDKLNEIRKASPSQVHAVFAVAAMTPEIEV